MNTEQTKKTVLIGFADALAAPEVFFSLYHNGYNVRVFQRANSSVPLSRLLPVGEPFKICAPEQNADLAKDDLAEILRTNQDIDILLAMDDTSLWLTNEALNALGADDHKPAFANASGAQKSLALDKTQQIEAAKAAGLSVPPTLVVTSPESLTDIKNFPTIVKPALAISMTSERNLSKGDSHYLFDEDAVQKLAKADTLVFPLLVQPLIHGIGQGVFGFAGHKGVSQIFGHQRIRMMNPHGSGASACVSMKPDAELVEQVKTLITSVGWRGPFMVEFLTDDDGTHWFVELNGRLWGSTALSRRHGYEYPTWAVEQATDPEFIPGNLAAVRSDSPVRHLGRDLLHLLFVLRGPKSEFHAERWPSFLKSLSGVLSRHARPGFYNYDRAFPLFFLRDALATVLKAVRKRSK
ncbi:hypothetical protein [Roseibium sp.]|uniref:hypothetical protein n=1 Tax=Roseibium sp. TaxID=1936156 RepID=UPI003BA9DA75